LSVWRRQGWRFHSGLEGTVDLIDLWLDGFGRLGYDLGHLKRGNSKGDVVRLERLKGACEEGEDVEIRDGRPSSCCRSLSTTSLQSLNHSSISFSRS